jgi:predicted aspartyl protease
MNIDQLLDAMTDSLGGPGKIRRSRIYHLSGTIRVGAMEGSFMALEDDTTHRERQELDLGAFRQVSGYNGDLLWMVDANGKIRTSTDPERVAEHLIGKRLVGNDYLVDRDDYIFSLDEGNGEYLLRVTSREHSGEPFATVTLAVDPASFLVVRRESVEQGHRSVSELSDYREMGGMLLPAVTRSIDAAENESIVTIDHVESLDQVDEGAFDPPAEDVRDFRFLDGGTSSVIPIRIPYDHIFTDVKIGDRSYQFVVDTGAGSTVLGADTAAELGLESLGTFNGQGVSGSQELMLIRLPEMVVGGIALENQQVIAMDFSELGKRLPGMSGLLGMDFLNRFVVKFDYVKGEMEVFDRESFVYEGKGERIPIDGGINVAMTFDGHEGKFHIDTGAGGLSIHSPFVRKLRLLPNPDALPSSSSVSGVGTVELTIYRALAHSVRIGSFELRDVPVELTAIETGSFANEATMGNVGAVIWRRFITWFDFTGGWLILEPNSNFDEPFRMGRFGVGFKSEDGRYVVESVTTHSPGARLGLLRGDELIEIDGRRAADLTIDQLHLLFCAPKGTVRHMKIGRGDGRQEEIDALLDDFVGHYDE